jgi:hypothetical protein
MLEQKNKKEKLNSSTLNVSGNSFLLVGNR